MSRISCVRSITLSSVKSEIDLYLGRRQFMVEYQQGRADLQGMNNYFREFTLADYKLGVRLRPLLHDGVEDLDA